MPSLTSGSNGFGLPGGPGKQAPLFRPLSPIGLAVRMAVLILPTALLLGGTVKTWEMGRITLILGLGTVFQVVVCGFNLSNRQAWRQLHLSAVFLPYLAALAWLWLATAASDWYLQFAQAMLLLVSFSVLGYQVLTDSGAPEARRARLLAQRLAGHKHWPQELEPCRHLPEVKALREALHADAAPALALLAHSRPQVRLAALAALEFRKSWRKGQADLVLRIAGQAPEPEIRAAGLYALANVYDRLVVEEVAEFLRDPVRRVRRAALEALFWDTERRWSWIRHAVRRALADAACQEDGPLLHRSQLLTREAIKDLTGWAGEKGLLGVRASMTLGVYYGRILNEQPGTELVADLRRQLANPQSPAPLRMELAQLLQTNLLLDRELLQKLIDPLNPAPLRLLAADVLLGEGPHPEAEGALYDIARLPNRELGLATAEVIQRRLNVDLGLNPGEPSPRPHSRQAAEVTRRVMMWASEKTSGASPLQSHPLL